MVCNCFLLLHSSSFFLFIFYLLFILPEVSGIGILIKFSVEAAPGFLLMPSKLYFYSALESVYFCLV